MPKQHYPSRQPKGRRSTGGAPRIERTVRKKAAKIIPSRYSEKDLKEMPIQVAAKVLRVELAQMFPDAPFSVRIDQYSGGERIDVNWVDGPSTYSVEAMLPKYKKKRAGDSSPQITITHPRLGTPQRMRSRKTAQATPNTTTKITWRSIESSRVLSFAPKPVNTRPTM